MIGIVQAVAKGGCGIVRGEDKTVFVPGVIGGETIEFDIQSRQKGTWHGDLRRIIDPSPYRVEAPCRHYRDCGGCNLQHMSYAEQLRCKEGIFSANLRKIAGIRHDQPMAVLPSPPFRYRSKIELQVRDGRRGFFRKKTRQLVAIGQCLLLSEAAEHFVLELAPFSGTACAVLQVLDNGIDLAARLQDGSGKISWLGPQRTLSFVFPPYRYRYGPEHFIQANRCQMPVMLQLLETHLPANSATATADLFCGCGFFTLPLARRFERVLAMECDANNLLALRANLESNRIHNVDVRPENALTADLPPLDLVVLDPPRGGLTAATIVRVVRSGAKKVIYYSCDSATFARDLRLFMKQGFCLRELKLIDNFPQTDHFEIFSLLEK